VYFENEPGRRSAAKLLTKERGEHRQAAGASLLRAQLTYLIIKAALSGIIIMIVSEVSRRSPSIGGLIASLPLISILAFIWLWRDTSDTERIAAQAEATFWYIFPSIPMFLALPAMLRNGVGFWVALSLSCVLTLVLYSVTMWFLPRIGINI